MKKVSVYRMIFLVGLYSIFANLAHPLEPTLYQNLGFHDYMFGVAFGAMAFTNFAFSTFWGNLFDKFGCANITGISLIGYAAAQYLFFMSTTEIALTLARLLAGVFISAISVSQILYIMRYSDKKKTTKNLMYCATTSAVISPIGYLIGGLMGDYSIKATMIAQVAGLAGIGVLFFLILGDSMDREEFSLKELAHNSNPLKSFKDASKYLTPVLIVFFLIAAATSFAGTCYEQSFNYLIKDQYGFPASYNGFLKAIVGIIAFVANFTVCSYLLKKTNVQHSIIYVLAICLAMSFGIVMIKDVVPFIIINVVFFGFNSVYLPLLQATLNQVSSDENDGIFAGMFNAVRSIGMIGGSLIAGFVYEISPRFPFILTAVFFAAAVVLAAVNYRQFQDKGVSLISQE